MGAYGSLHSWVLVALTVVIAVRARDFKFNVRACEICGERDEHAVGCPGRRGY